MTHRCCPGGISRRRLAALLVAAAVLCGWSAARATALIDPFLERFRVGFYQDPDKIALADGWPVELFTPCRVDPAWREAAAAWFGSVSARPDSLLLWRFLDAALGPREAVSAWEASHQTRWAALCGTPTPPEVMSGIPAGGWLYKDLLYQEAFTAYEIKNYRMCELAAMQLLDRRSELGLEPDEVFVWTLRLRRLEALGAGSPQPETAPWPELQALTPADAVSGWALWVAHRRASGLAVLPAGATDQNLARWLARLRRSWLTEQDLTAAQLPDAVVSGLGAVTLPPGPALEQHFTRWPSPPADQYWQEAWLRGRLRPQGWPAEPTERWAARRELLAASRVRLWRRASEDRLLRGQWTLGLSDLRSGFAVAGAGQSSAGMRRELAAWAGQVLALALAHDRPRDASRVTTLVRAHLTPGEWKSWQAAVSPSRRPPAGLGAAPSAGASLAARAERTVRSGAAPKVVLAPSDPTSSRLGREQERLWESWARWGLALAAQDTRLSSLRARESDYQAGLGAVLAASGESDRRALACAAIGRYLRGDPAREAFLDWLLDRDITRLAGGAWTAPADPPFGRSRAGAGAWAASHALLGACLAAGDLSGQLLLARDLPSAGLPEPDRLRLLFPVPAAGPLRAALAQAPVEEPLLLALARNESLFDPTARSGAGALGILQIMPFHFRERGLEQGEPQWRLPALGIRMGAGLLAESARAYGRDPYRTAAAYNAGAEAVARWTRQLRGRPDRDLFLSWIGYAETRSYVEKVLIDRQIYSWILSGGQNDAP